LLEGSGCSNKQQFGIKETGRLMKSRPAEFNVPNSTRFGAVKGGPLAPLCY
jgi:hypothetical protein